MFRVETELVVETVTEQDIQVQRLLVHIVMVAESKIGLLVIFSQMPLCYGIVNVRDRIKTIGLEFLQNVNQEKIDIIRILASCGSVDDYIATATEQIHHRIDVFRKPLLYLRKYTELVADIIKRRLIIHDFSLSFPRNTTVLSNRPHCSVSCSCTDGTVSPSAGSALRKICRFPSSAPCLSVPHCCN